MFRKATSRPEHSVEVKRKQDYLPYVSQKSQLKTWSIDYVKNISLLLELQQIFKFKLAWNFSSDRLCFLTPTQCGRCSSVYPVDSDCKESNGYDSPNRLWVSGYGLSIWRSTSASSIISRMTWAQRRGLAELLCIGANLPSKQWLSCEYEIKNFSTLADHLSWFLDSLACIIMNRTSTVTVNLFYPERRCTGLLVYQTDSITSNVLCGVLLVFESGRLSIFLLAWMINYPRYVNVLPPANNSNRILLTVTHNLESRTFLFFQTLEDHKSCLQISAPWGSRMASVLVGSSGKRDSPESFSMPWHPYMRLSIFIRSLCTLLSLSDARIKVSS